MGKGTPKDLLKLIVKEQGVTVNRAAEELNVDREKILKFCLSLEEKGYANLGTSDYENPSITPTQKLLDKTIQGKNNKKKRRESMAGTVIGAVVTLLSFFVIAFSLILSFAMPVSTASDPRRHWGITEWCLSPLVGAFMPLIIGITVDYFVDNVIGYSKKERKEDIKPKLIMIIVLIVVLTTIYLVSLVNLINML